MSFQAVSSALFRELFLDTPPLDTFNHTKRSWLVIWEAGVVIELPPWVLLLYPSSLLYHFNIDINGRSSPPLAFLLLYLAPFSNSVCDDRRPPAPNS